MMESPYYAPPQMDASRPSIGFPLGTALLLIIIFSLSGVFSCCYHWDKLRSFRRSFDSDRDLEADDDGSLSKPNPTYTSSKQNQSQSLPVLMPGDQIPKFIALPCPCEPPRPEKIIVEVQKPPKPPRIAVPLY
ncbi:hydroxyproline-rich glycoprotein family protein [Actinidia rufa]|uniref:Hydroxyproline-rich glycoprotein family protein n=1 Tax=Actinidia rufa TaxID=165716 RepID=A0A7J0H7G5_9ERIC|nr:hydroxyproline-rich glycoprotein family protein [Actinidia rufa]